ncbi:MAG: ribonuclease HII [Hyphomicrobiales bacterium]
MEKYFIHKGLEAGCDEAGRGCLAGPVVAAAVILPKEIDIELDDSKKLSEKKRNLLVPKIKEHALSYAIGVVSPEEIDKINILNASFLAMHRALDQLQQVPDRILVDGNRFNKYKTIEHHCIIKGDGKYASIAAASILAKTYRDELMENYHKSYPDYDWKKNKGYPTKFHREAIEQHGSTDLHRKSFTVKTQLKMDI